MAGSVVIAAFVSAELTPVVAIAAATACNGVSTDCSAGTTCATAAAVISWIPPKLLAHAAPSAATPITINPTGDRMKPSAAPTPLIANINGPAAASTAAKAIAAFCSSGDNVVSPPTRVAAP